MPNINNKIKSYTGFAIKAGKVVYGVDNILKNSPKFVIFDKNLGQAGKRKLLNFLETRQIDYYQTDINEIIQKENCKAIGIQERNLINAIKKVIKES